MIPTLYFILFAIPFFYLALLLFRFRQSISVYYVLLPICIIRINYGYWQGSVATMLEEALAANRVYKEQFSFEQAFSMIQESGGSHFDPFLCQQFLACRDRLISVCSANADA